MTPSMSAQHMYLCVIEAVLYSQPFCWPHSYVFIDVFGIVLVYLVAVACMYNPSNSRSANRFTQPSIIPAHNNSSGTAAAYF